MNRRHPMAMVAAGSVLLAAVPLSSLFQSFSWFAYSAITVGLVVGAAMLARTARWPVWAQVLAMLAALLLFLTLAFPSGDELFRLIPTESTFLHFNDLLVTAGQQIRAQSVPVPDIDSLLMLVTLGVGLVAVVVDVVAVGLRRPALAGLPMLAIYSVPVAVLPDGVPAFMFLFAAAGFMWLLISDSVDRVRRFGRRFTGEGRDVDVWEPSPLAAAGRTLAIVGLVVAIVVPIAVPGLSHGLLDTLRNDNTAPGVSGTGGVGSTVDLSAYLTDQLLIRDTVVPMVRVSTTDPDPYYLRFGVADTISQNGFVARPPSGGDLNEIPGFGTPDVPGLTTAGYEATVQVLPDFTMPLAPAYQQLTSVDGLDRAWFYDTNSDLIFSRASTAAGKLYTVHYTHVRYTPEALRSAPAVPADFRPLAQVPAVAQVSDLVDGLTKGQTNEYDRVRSIYDYFTDPAHNFVYSIVAPVSRSGNPIVDFLDSRKGFCVQYAASMAWLVRTAGYPARVAFGFTRGTGPNSANVSTLSNVNLHAWAEVYFPNFGWVPFDTTPASAVAGSVQSAWAPDPTKPDQTQPGVTPSASGGLTGPDDTLQPKGGTSTTPVTATQTSSPLMQTWVLGLIALVVALIVIAVTPAMRRRALTRRRRTRSGHTIDLDIGAGPLANPLLGQVVTDPAGVAMARRDAHAAWAELHDTMIDFRINVDDAETPRATTERLGELLYTTGAKDSMALLGRAEERARYARLPLRADGLDDAVRLVRAGLAAQATRVDRLLAAVLPRSVTLRWRLAWVNRLAAIMAGAARTRAALGAADPRRALSRAGAR
jgi:transglutaminase-like putative cysteine protease